MAQPSGPGGDPGWAHHGSREIYAGHIFQGHSEDMPLGAWRAAPCHRLIGGQGRGERLPLQDRSQTGAGAVWAPRLFALSDGVQRAGFALPQGTGRNLDAGDKGRAPREAGVVTTSPADTLLAASRLWCREGTQVGSGHPGQRQSWEAQSQGGSRRRGSARAAERGSAPCVGGAVHVCEPSCAHRRKEPPGR